MGKETKISWTSILDAAGQPVPGSTFNPWEGCAKVSAGCKNCYAETQHTFYYAALAKGEQPGTCWGVSAPRLARSAAYWRAPLAWDQLAAAAQASGRETNRRRVFCASMADVFEDQGALSRSFAGTTGTVPTGQGRNRTVQFVDVATERLRLLRLVYATPHLDWLLLTKRPEHVVPALVAAYEAVYKEEKGPVVATSFMQWLWDWSEAIAVPANVWLGTSVENQAAADARIPHLLAAPAARRFLSCEPLLGPVALPLKYCVGCRGFTQTIEVNNGQDWGCARCKTYQGSHKGRAWKPPGVSGIDWVIAGGESGAGARPLEAAWVRSLQAQCTAAGVPLLFKQLGSTWAKLVGAADKHGADLADIPAEFRVRESPGSQF